MNQHICTYYCLRSMLITLLMIPFLLPAMNKKNLVLKMVMEQQLCSPLSPKSPSSCGTPTPLIITPPPTQIRWATFLENCKAPKKTFKLIKLYKKNLNYFEKLIENEKERIESIFNPNYETTEKNKFIEYQKLNALVPRKIAPGLNAIAVLWENLLFVTPHEGNLSDSLFETAFKETPSLLSWAPKNNFFVVASENQLFIWSKEARSIFKKSLTLNGTIEKIVWAPNERSFVALASKNHWATLYFCHLSTKKSPSNVNPLFKLLALSDPTIITAFDDDEDGINQLSYADDSKSITIMGDFLQEPLIFEITKNIL